MELIIVIGVIAVLLIVITYNVIIKLRNSVLENKSTIDTMFQKRYELIPNLVEVVQQYAKHEKSTLESVVTMRTNAMSGQDFSEEKLSNENMLSGTLKSIFALSESYPDLKADSSFINLQNEWSDIESNIQSARRGYNSAVTMLRNKIQTIPSNIVANFMVIETYPLFQADEVAKKSINAKELFNK